MRRSRCRACIVSGAGLDYGACGLADRGSISRMFMVVSHGLSDRFDFPMSVDMLAGQS